jgi:hypothetical protein
VDEFHHLHLIHLLGLAPAGYLTAPDNGPEACCGDAQVKASADAAVPLNAAESSGEENLRGGEFHPLWDTTIRSTSPVVFQDVICNNNNTFTWSGPSGVLGCTGQRPGGPPRRGVHAKYPKE